MKCSDSIRVFAVALTLGVVWTPVPAAAANRAGSIVRSEAIAGPAGTAAWKIVYVSSGLDGKPIDVSGVVVAPLGSAPRGGRSVVAWAHPTTGVAQSCAPSSSPAVFKTIPGLGDLIARGFVVAATDYPGLGTSGVHPYLVGVSEGRAVLDAVRAARNLPAAGAGPRFVAWGHSQGGQAALFTGQLAARYAPDLRLVGVAAIAPATDLERLLRDDLSVRSGRVLGAYSLWSWSHVYGGSLAGVVKPFAIPIVDRIAKICIQTKGEGYRVALASLPIGPKFILNAFYSTQPWKDAFATNTPGRAPAGAPVFIAQGTKDAVVQPEVTAAFVAGLCKRGENVTLDRLVGVGHMTAGIDSATAAIAWMTDRFAGKAPPNTCGKI